MTSRVPDRLRVLVVDDSAYNRQTIAGMVETLPGVQVVGRATNGKEALRLAFDLQPDVITLDLEMPEMDGFSFLRLLMNKRPTPVLVVSSHAARENVFRALELGALDFIPKPSSEVTPELRNIEQELLQKIGMVRRLQAVRLRDRALALQRIPRPTANADIATPQPPRCVVAVGASTGGPPAVQQLLAAVPRNLPVALVIAQHMPARFTRAFAERLDRIVALRVLEAEDGMPLVSGCAYVAPGAAHLELAVVGDTVCARVTQAVPGGATITPSADRLFRSCATIYGARMVAVVLTGMGSDGRDGASAAHAAGARVLVEDPRSAVMSGMPQSAIDAGVADEIASVEGLAASIVRFAQGWATTPT